MRAPWQKETCDGNNCNRRSTVQLEFDDETCSNYCELHFGAWVAGRVKTNDIVCGIQCRDWSEDLEMIAALIAGVSEEQP